MELVPSIHTVTQASQQYKHYTIQGSSIVEKTDDDFDVSTSLETMFPEADINLNDIQVDESSIIDLDVSLSKVTPNSVNIVKEKTLIPVGNTELFKNIIVSEVLLDIVHEKKAGKLSKHGLYLAVYCKIIKHKLVDNTNALARLDDTMLKDYMMRKYKHLCGFLLGNKIYTCTDQDWNNSCSLRARIIAKNPSLMKGRDSIAKMSSKEYFMYCNKCFTKRSLDIFKTKCMVENNMEFFFNCDKTII